MMRGCLDILSLLRSSTVRLLSLSLCPKCEETDHIPLFFSFVAALDVLGVECRAVWGQQWIKLLAITYEGVTKGYQPGKLIGGDSPEGSAGRTRALLAVETIMSTP